MDKQVRTRILKPDYKRIYSDLIDKKFPERKKEFKFILEKKTLKSFKLFL